MGSHALWGLIYRLFFHPLSRFPGPKLAAATKWYEFYFDLMKGNGGTFTIEVDRMHEVYGPIVRINPDELHVKDPEWLDVLYTGVQRGTRDKYPPAAHMVGTPKAIFGTIDHVAHRKRRATISPFFSTAAIASAQSQIHEKVNLLCEKADGVFQSGGVVDLRVAYLALTTDVISEHAFGRSLCMLHDDQRAVEWHKTIRAIPRSTLLIRQFLWIPALLLRMPAAVVGLVLPDLARIVAMRHDIYKQAKAVIRDWEYKTFKADMVSHDHVPKPANKLLFEHILEHMGLPDEEKEFHRIAQEGFTVLAAGIETTARHLATCTFHILANKETIFPRLKAELVTAMPDPYAEVDIKTLESLPWLSAIIIENLRITAMAIYRSPRVSPIETLTYGDWIIPPGTPVSMNFPDILLDPTIFPNPYKFMPERWLPFPDGTSCNGKTDISNLVWLPFGRGNRICVGMSLALAELYTGIAHMFRRFDLHLHDTTWERDVELRPDCLFGEPSKENKGVRVGGKRAAL